MGRNYFLIVLPLFLWLFSPTPAVNGNSVLPVETAASPGNTLFRGHLSIGTNDGTFIQCNTNSRHALIDNTGGELLQVYEELAYEPEAEVYVEFSGRKTLQNPEKLTLLKLHHVAVETRGCTEVLTGFSFRVFGNEPFWQVVITTEKISFMEMGQPEIVFPPAIPSFSDDHWDYATETAGPRRNNLP